MSQVPSEKINELDFNTIRQNFLDFVRNQSEFGDYDFDASGLNFLVDLLAYNTQYSSFYLNQVASEMFLDTAQQRKNVVSIAKQMGYLANSKKAGNAIIKVQLVNATAINTAINLPAGTRFLGKKADGSTHPFVTQRDYSFNRVNNYTAELNLVQGSYSNQTIIVNQQLLENRFQINSKDVDIDYLTVYVKENTRSPDRVKFTRVTDVTLLSKISNVYYLEENYDGYYEVVFGDGVIGKEVVNNNVIELNYLISSGASGNDCLTFDLTATTALPTKYFIQSIQYSAQGADKEEIETIRNNARRLFFSQNRAVTENDYEIQLLKYFPYIDTISVWGGENNEVPLYGTVFCALKPKGRTYLTDTEKNTILTRLDSLNVISILPKIVDPIYVYVRLSVDVVYDIEKVELTESEIIDLVTDSALTFSENNLLKFFRRFQVTALTREIDTLDESFLGTSSKINLYQSRKITINVPTSYQIDFNNKLKKGSFTATTFKHYDQDQNLIDNCYLSESDDFKKIQIKTSQGFILVDEVGTIDYDSGLVSLEGFSPAFIEGNSSEMEFDVEVDTYIITPTKEQILLITADDISVSPVGFLNENSNTSTISNQA